MMSRPPIIQRLLSTPIVFYYPLRPTSTLIREKIINSAIDKQVSIDLSMNVDTYISQVENSCSKHVACITFWKSHIHWSSPSWLSWLWKTGEESAEKPNHNSKVIKEADLGKASLRWEKYRLESYHRDKVWYEVDGRDEVDEAANVDEVAKSTLCQKKVLQSRVWQIFQFSNIFAPNNR